MAVLFMLLYMLAGVFFGLAAARVVSKVDFLALGLLMWAIVLFLKALQGI